MQGPFRDWYFLQRFFLVLKQKDLYSPDFFYARGAAGGIKKSIYPFILDIVWHWRHIRYRDIYIFRIEVSIDQCGLSAAAYPGAYPFGMVQSAEYLVDMVQISHSLFECEILPLK